ncbi:MAG: class 1 fructose-bisphosphatase [Beijerinckiaceae bacterium]
MPDAKDPADRLQDELADNLAAWSGQDIRRVALAKTLTALAAATKEIAGRTFLGPLGGRLGAATGDANADGDKQKRLDVLSNDAVLEALKRAPVAYFASEEEIEILTLHGDGMFAVAVDPLDGSSNIDTNAPIGTIFSVYPASPAGATASFFRPGREQVAAGYAIYGQHTALLLTVGEGVDMYVLDGQNNYRRVAAGLSIPPRAQEYAINASNYRFWREPVRDYIDELLAGVEGPRGRDFNMRWLASLVGDAHRILQRGGVYLYPADRRPGYEQGRLRLVYEAAPIAYLVEQAGGAATDGLTPILDKIPEQLHARTALVFGSKAKVERVTRYHTDPPHDRARPPLFAPRGLFRV